MEAALRVHEDSVRRLFVDRHTADQADAIRTWSEQTIGARPSTPPTTAD